MRSLQEPPRLPTSQWIVVTRAERRPQGLHEHRRVSPLPHRQAPPEGAGEETHSRPSQAGQTESMKVLFIAGFGPITSNVTESRRLYEEALGIRFKVEDGEYLHTEEVKGANTFAVWPLAQAAESCFRASESPAATPAPHAWLAFDVSDIEAAPTTLED